eukprot:gene8237-biopygen22610
MRPLPFLPLVSMSPCGCMPVLWVRNAAAAPCARHSAWGHRIVARAWRGRGAGCMPFFSLGGAGVARACPVTPVRAASSVTEGGTGTGEPSGISMSCALLCSQPARARNRGTAESTSTAGLD